MIREFNSLEEIQKYYEAETNTYVFRENDRYIDLVKFNFDLNVNANIDACDIIALNITANDINANDINARNIDAENIDALDIIACGDINANDISYCAVCVAYENIKCKSIIGFREDAKHFVLDGELEMEEDE